MWNNRKQPYFLKLCSGKKKCIRDVSKSFYHFVVTYYIGTIYVQMKQFWQKLSEKSFFPATHVAQKHDFEKTAHKVLKVLQTRTHKILLLKFLSEFIFIINLTICLNRKSIDNISKPIDNTAFFDPSPSLNMLSRHWFVIFGLTTASSLEI